MADINLRPCPLCGGEVQMRTMYVERDDLFQEYIVCNHCGLYFYGSMDGLSAEGLQNEWNTRKPMERIVEQLEEFREEAKQFGADGMLTDIIDVVKRGGVDGTSI